jgi:outer membrane protein assembly factor BamB
VSKLFLCLLLATLPLAASADNWPAWRGAQMNGQSSETALPLQWSATENVRWKAPLPGPGMSSPIIWKDRIFVTQALDPEGHRRALLCFARKDGKQLWQGVTEYVDKESTYAGEPHYCSASPVTDGQRVVCSFGSAGVVCYDFRGTQLWRRDLGKCEHIWGNAASPMLYGNLVVLNFGPGERTYLVALDKRTGQDVWRVEEPGGKFGQAPSEWIGSWSTPVVLKLKDHDELIVMWAGAVKAYQPKTGEPLWTCQGLGNLVYNSPLVTPEIVVAFSGFGGPALAVKPGGKGDVTATHRLWHLPDRAPQRIGSGVIVGEHVYILNAIGTAQCFELRTGHSLWEERVGASAWGSMVHAGGRLYVTNQQGETVVLAAKPVFEVLAHNPLGERSQSSPAVSDGELFIRTYGHLWCISLKR